MASGVGFLVFGSALILFAQRIGQLGDATPSEAFLILALSAAPNAVFVYALTLALGDLALRKLKLGGVLPYAVLGLVVPVLLVSALRLAAQGHLIAVWECLLIMPAGLLGGYVLGLRRAGAKSPLE